MKLKLIALFILWAINFASFAAPITMPDRNIIKKRLEKAGLGHFAEKTHIADKLENQTMLPLAIALTINLSLCNYTQDLEQNIMPGLSNFINKDKLLKILLEDSPEALTELQQQGEYQP